MRTDLRTVAEESGWRRTSLHREVVAYLERLAGGNPSLALTSMGRSALGQDLVVAVASADGISTPAAARASGLPVVLVVANIHAGEVEGKEASLALARDATTGPLRRLVERAVVLFLPDYNPDGNDRIDPRNRALDLGRLEGQVGPDAGVGTRTTAEGVNLNRDYVKQAAPESRHLAAFLDAWRPHVVVDCHTTDGSIHGYDLTFDTSRNLASCPPGLPAWTRDTLLREVARGLRARTGRRTWFYGNFREPDDPESGWETYPPQPRYGSHYRGLQGVVDVLLETYSYIDYRARFDTIYETLVEVVDRVGARGREVVDLVARAERETVARGSAPAADDRVGVAYGVAQRGPLGVSFRFPAQPLEEVEIEGWDLESTKRRVVPGRERRTWRNVYYGRYEPSVRVRRPFAYVVPASAARAVERLRGHRLEVRPVAREADVEVEAYRVTRRESTGSPDIGSSDVPETVLSVEAFPERLRVRPGDVVVPCGQRLGHVAIHLLEPEADDGLARWGFFDDALSAGSTFPARRVLSDKKVPGTAISECLAPPYRS